jgi:hypothetical protein
MDDMNQSPTLDSPFKVAVMLTKQNEIVIIMQLSLQDEEPQYFELTTSEASQLGTDLLGATGAAVMGEHMQPHLTDEQRTTLFGDRW